MVIKFRRQSRLRMGAFQWVPLPDVEMVAIALVNTEAVRVHTMGAWQSGYKSKNTKNRRTAIFSGSDLGFMNNLNFYPIQVFKENCVVAWGVFRVWFCSSI